MKDYVEDEKLYRVYRKRENHINRTPNADGMIAGIQFTDDSNTLDGPVFIVPVEGEDHERDNDVCVSARGQSLGQIIMEEVIVPAAKEVIEEALYVGCERLSKWTKEVVFPKAEKRGRELWKEAKTIWSAVKDEIKGKEIKAIKSKKSTQGDEVEIVSWDIEGAESDAEVVSPEEINFLINKMKESAEVIAACIRFLTNAAISDDGSNPSVRKELQRNLEILAADEVMKRIDLLLEDKNSSLLDEVSRSLLAAFREGHFIINGIQVPISNYIVGKA